MASAKAKLSEVVQRAQAEGPQLIANRGEVVAVVVSADEWRRRTEPPGAFLDFVLGSPLRGSGVEFPRVDELPREVKL